MLTGRTSQDLDEAVVLGNDHAAYDIFDGKPRLDAVPVGPAAGRVLDAAAKMSSFRFTISPPHDKITLSDSAASATKKPATLSGCHR